MSYLVVGVLGLIIAIMIVAGLVKPKKGAEPTENSNNGVTPDKPAAEEPTPARSSTASLSQAEQARRRTPPA